MISQYYLIIFQKEKSISVFLTVFINNEGKYYTGILSSVLYNKWKTVSSVLSFLHLYLFLAGNIVVYTPSQATNREKYCLKVEHQS